MVNVVEVFYRNRRACVRVKRREGELYKIEVGLRKGVCYVSWLFNILMDNAGSDMERI